jgi:hypothetical protein
VSCWRWKATPPTFPWPFAMTAQSSVAETYAIVRYRRSGLVRATARKA